MNQAKKDVARSSCWNTYTLESKIPDVPGCYAVYIDGQLVYVGQSANVRDRLLLAHKFNYARYSNNFATPWGIFKDLRFKVRASRRFGDWLMVEARLIRRLRPQFNRLGAR